MTTPDVQVDTSSYRHPNPWHKVPPIRRNNDKRRRKRGLESIAEKQEESSEYDGDVVMAELRDSLYKMLTVTDKRNIHNEESELCLLQALQPPELANAEYESGF